MKLCPKCGTHYPDDANFCPDDAARLTPGPSSAERGMAVGPATAAHGTASAAARDEPVDESEGRTGDGRRLLGRRFALSARLGGRQTGEVYEATDQNDGRACVVKLVDPEVFPSSLVLQRTERELGKLARIESAGIARILGHGRVDGRLWMACERVPGSQSLLDIVFDEGPMPATRAAAIILDVGKALAEAAKVGIIHRDLAPKNVLVSGGGTVKLINFGVAVPTTRKVQGVPEFVAPEIVEGKAVDQRANIYSLGALFYYLVTGRPPYMGEPEEVYAQHLSAEPEPPSAQLETVPEAVDAVILRALARSSSRRFMTLRQFLNDVERVAAGEEPMTTSSVMGQLIPARGKNKSKKLAQTMLGGFHAAQDAARKQAEEDARNQAAAAGAADSATAAGAAAGVATGSGGDAAEPQAAAGASEAAGLAAAGAAAIAAAPEAVAASGMLGARDDEATEGHKAEAATPTEPLAAAADTTPDASSEAAEAAPSTGKFRETKWFKEGVAAEASALLEASRSAARGVTKGDSGQYSLQTGATKVMASVRNAKAESDDVSSRELIKEMKGGRGKIVLMLVLVLVALLIVFAVTR
jgi:hypothetical protein